MYDIMTAERASLVKQIYKGPEIGPIYLQI